MKEGEIRYPGLRAERRKRLTPMDWASNYAAVRGDNTPEKNPMHCCKRGFGEWCWEASALQEEDRSRYFAYNTVQKQQRRTSFDHITTGNSNVREQVGQRIVLPSCHQGSWRNMRGRYCDAMALARRYGKPSFFISLTPAPRCCLNTKNAGCRTRTSCCSWLRRRARMVAQIDACVSAELPIP